MVLALRHQITLLERQLHGDKPGSFTGTNVPPELHGWGFRHLQGQPQQHSWHPRSVVTDDVARVETVKTTRFRAGSQTAGDQGGCTIRHPQCCPSPRPSPHVAAATKLETLPDHDPAGSRC